MSSKKKVVVSKKTSFQSRPPVVTVLGHVDHGKTSLISKIYQTDLTKKESGGISQHIGAYQVDFQGQKITFIDTPGHAAFAKMRSQGAKVADLVVLVVAADEGVKPQTLESLKYIQQAEVPFLVAINKIDLPNFSLDKTKKNLAENGILVEGYGGKTVVLPVSAKTGQGIKDLLEMILLLGEMEELKADPEGELEAVVIESKLDTRRGALAAVLVRNGQLIIGEQIEAGGIMAKIKTMLDDRGKKVKITYPGQVVEVLGFTNIPPVGAKVKKTNFSLEKTEFSHKFKKNWDQPLVSTKPSEKKMKIILKADVVGTLEAIIDSLPREVEIILAQVGEVTESDILLASTTGAAIVGFRVKIPQAVKKLTEFEGVKIQLFLVIYELLEEMEKQIKKILKPLADQQILGQAEIMAEFEINGQRVAGCKVKEGQINKAGSLHLKRGEEILGDFHIKSMKKGKADIVTAKKEEEFGVILSKEIDFKTGDMLISFK